MVCLNTAILPDRQDSDFFTGQVCYTPEVEFTYKIPKGSTILRGKAASMAGEPGFGPKAVGGGEQIYISDPKKAVLIDVKTK
jgi:hypothetical protein